MPDNDVRVGIIGLDAGGDEVSTTARELVARSRETNGFQVSSKEVAFGLALRAETDGTLPNAVRASPWRPERALVERPAGWFRMRKLGL
ncbi:hypothetical protein F4561_003492 [Lipingzhangella halophila]|uniref:Uncharacterized protein n=1 Tax=Lipingzhangella halophila TaxID=1783352 RepID=A0A7W7RIM2_9ACTN|nr:hypothetical protein [Lipingzhangella halophila]MBB4932672.1 hypothetical protein [Lipingzhangella halophila]